MRCKSLIHHLSITYSLIHLSITYPSLIHHLFTYPLIHHLSITYPSLIHSSITYSLIYHLFTYPSLLHHLSITSLHIFTHSSLVHSYLFLCKHGTVAKSKIVFEATGRTHQQSGKEQTVAHPLQQRWHLLEGSLFALIRQLCELFVAEVSIGELKGRPRQLDSEHHLRSGPVEGKLHVVVVGGVDVPHEQIDHVEAIDEDV